MLFPLISLSCKLDDVNVDSIVFLLDRNLNILRANRSVEMLQKGSADTLVGQSITTLFSDITDV